MPEIRFGKRYALRPAQGQLLVDGRPVPIGGRAFDVLRKLVEHAGETVSKRELMDCGWPDSVVEENNLQVQISRLRRVLEPDAIVTVAGRGYRLSLAVEDQPEAPPTRRSPSLEARKSRQSVSASGAAVSAAGLPLLERDEALRTLAAGLARARTGRGNVCLVSGEAGIGKTALCNAFVGGLDVRVLRGSCEAFFSPQPMGPIYDFATELDPALRTLIRQEANHVEAFARILQLLETQPTVLWLEDLHWCDTATLDLIRYLRSRIRKTPVLLLLTYRDDELAEGHPLHQLLGGLQGSATRIKLQPLSPAAVEELARARGQSAQGIYAATGGNPFEVTELLKSGGLPESVREAVLARLTKQGPDVQALLELVAIAADPIEQSLVQELLDCDEATIRRALSSGLLLGDGVIISFRHELDRRAVEQSIASHRARRLHARMLEVLRTGPDPVVCAARCLHHARAAGLKSEVLRYSVIGARDASQRGAHREAVALCREALQDSDNSMPQEHAELLEIMSVARSRFEANPETACSDLEAALEIWRQLGRGPDEGRVLRRLARMHWLLGNALRATEYAQASVQRLESFAESIEYCRALADQALTLYHTNRFLEARDIGGKALGLACASGDEKARCLALVAVGGAEVSMGETQSGLSRLQESLALALKSKFVVEAAITYVNLARSFHSCREYQQIERYCPEAMSFLASARDLDLFANRLRAIQCVARFESGRWSEAQKTAQALVELQSNAPWPWLEQTVLALIKAGRGELGGESRLEAAVKATGSRELLQMGGLVLAAQAQVQWLETGCVANIVGLRSAFSWSKEAHFQRHIQEIGYWLWRGGQQDVDGVDPTSPRGLQIAGNWREAAAEWHRLGCPLEEAQSLLQGNCAGRDEAKGIFLRLGASRWLQRSEEQIARGGS